MIHPSATNRRGESERDSGALRLDDPSPRGMWSAVGVILLIIGVLVLALSLTAGTEGDGLVVTTVPTGSVG